MVFERFLFHLGAEHILASTDIKLSMGSNQQLVIQGRCLFKHVDLDVHVHVDAVVDGICLITS